MKLKIASVFAAAFLCFALAGCANPNTTAANETPNATASESVTFSSSVVTEPPATEATMSETTPVEKETATPGYENTEASTGAEEAEGQPTGDTPAENS